MKVMNNKYSEIPPFRGYHSFNNNMIHSSQYRMWKNNIFIKDVYESTYATFKRLSLIDSTNNKPLLQKIIEVVRNVVSR